MRSGVSAAVARWPLKATRLASQMSDDPSDVQIGRWALPPLSVRASRIWILIGRAVEFRMARVSATAKARIMAVVSRGSAASGVMQMCGEAFEPLQRVGPHHRPVAGGVESTELARQRCYQQVGFRREIAVKRADGDADPLGNRPHLKPPVTTPAAATAKAASRIVSRRRAEARERDALAVCFGSDRVRFRRQGFPWLRA